MSSEQLAEIKLTNKREELRDEGKSPLTDEEAAAFKQQISDRFEKGISAWMSTAWVCDDGLIDPRDTRKVLANAISISLNAPLPPMNYGSFRI